MLEWHARRTMNAAQIDVLVKLGWTTDIHVGDTVRCCTYWEGRWLLEREELVVCCFSRSQDSPMHGPLDDLLLTWLSDGCGTGCPLVLVRKGPGLQGPPPRGTSVPAPRHGFEKRFNKEDGGAAAQNQEGAGGFCATGAEPGVVAMLPPPRFSDLTEGGWSVKVHLGGEEGRLCNPVQRRRWNSERGVYDPDSAYLRELREEIGMPRRTPDNFRPSNDLAWVVYLSPRSEVRHGVHEGLATASDVCSRLWPDVSQVDYWPSLGTTPIGWVTERLEQEARPCAQGGAGLLRRSGEYYISAMPAGVRPTWLLPRLL